MKKTTRDWITSTHTVLYQLRSSSRASDPTEPTCAASGRRGGETWERYTRGRRVANRIAEGRENICKACCMWLGFSLKNDGARLDLMRDVRG